MKKNRLFLVPLMAATLSLGSCSSDSPDMGGSDNTFKGDQAFMKVRIAMADDPSTRSVTDGGYEYGSTTEQAVKSLGFKFYYKNGKFAGYGESYPTNGSITTKPNTSNGQYVEAFADAVIALQVKEGEEKPVYAVAFVNCANDDWKESTEPDLSNIDLKIGKYGSDNEGYVMTSSNYKTDGYKTEVDPTKFFETSDAAILDENPVEIHVERVAAKVTVVKKDTPENSVEKDGYTFEFTIKGFALGGTNNESFLIKNLDQSWDATTLWSSWQPENEHRCFWAKDMNYTYADDGNNLTRASYSDAVDPGKYLYCHENTFAAAGQSTSNPYNVQPYVYVTGIYTVTKGTDPDVEIVKEDLFSYAGNIHPTSEMINIMQNAIGTVLYKKNTTTSPESYDGVNLKDEGLVEIVAQDANNVILQLKKVTDGDEEKAPDVSKYFINTGTKDDPIWTTATVEKVNALLAKPIKANGFKYDATAGGHLAYFPVLIEHLNFKTGTTRDKQPVGAYGVVRNHIYQLEINSISNLGIGVFDPDVIITPDTNTKTYYLGARIRILSWKVVKQGVDL